jgi:hypothetical protein
MARTSRQFNATRKDVTANLRASRPVAELTHTTAGARPWEPTEHFSDWQGNTNMVGSITFKSRLGPEHQARRSGTATRPTRAIPQYVEGVGFVVTFKISSTDSIGGGIGKGRFSANVGTSKANYQSGSKILKTLADAIDFRDNVRARASRSVFLPPPTSVEGGAHDPAGREPRRRDCHRDEYRGLHVLRRRPRLPGLRARLDQQRGTVGDAPRDMSVDVTRTYSDDTSSDPNISGLGLSNKKGHRRRRGSRGDLTGSTSRPSPARRPSSAGAADPGLPGPGATNRRVKTFRSQNAHDEYGFPVKYSASWQGSRWESKEVDEQGNVTETFGGGQDRDVRTGWFSENITRDKEQHANAQIEATLQNGKESYAARFTVSGKSGASNLEELGKIFMGANHEAGDSSGYWLLTAQIDPAVVRELEQNSKDFRSATTTADRMRIYRDHVRKHGAHMIGGQVRAGGNDQAWNLELPGDPNFPGAGGRAELNQQRARLQGQLKERPDSGRVGRLGSEGCDRRPDETAPGRRGQGQVHGPA